MPITICSIFWQIVKQLQAQDSNPNSYLNSPNSDIKNPNYEINNPNSDINNKDSCINNASNNQNNKEIRRNVLRELIQLYLSAYLSKEQKRSMTRYVPILLPMIILKMVRSVDGVKPNPSPQLNSHSGEKLRSSDGKSWCCCSSTGEKDRTGPSEP